MGKSRGWTFPRFPRRGIFHRESRPRIWLITFEGGLWAFLYAATMTDLEDWTKILGWPGYRVYQHEINEKKKTLKLWVRRKAGNQKLACGGCGQRVHEIREVYEREVRDLPWGQ